MLQAEGVTHASLVRHWGRSDKDGTGIGGRVH